MIQVLTLINAVSTFSVLFKFFCYVLYYSSLFHWKIKNHFGVVLVYLGLGLYKYTSSCSKYYFTETGRKLNTGLLGIPPFSLNYLIIIKHILIHFLMVFGMSHIKVK